MNFGVRPPPSPTISSRTAWAIRCAAIAQKVTMTTILPPDHIPVMPAGRRMRVCVEYGPSIRALLWLNVAKDGSLYTGYSTRGIGPSKELIPKQLPDGAFEFEWEGERRLLTSMRDKISFHASGIILSDIGRSVGVNLRLLSQRTLLCSYLPKHPDDWRVVRGTASGDIVITQLLSDDCPMVIELFYQPAGSLPILASRLDEGFFVLPIGYESGKNHKRVLLHLVFRRQPQAVNWSRTWIMTWPSVRNRKEPSCREEWMEPGS